MEARWLSSKLSQISPEPGTSALMCRLTIYDLLWKNKPGKSCAAVWTWPHNLGPSKPSSCSLNESCLFQAGSITATKISAINNCQRTGFEYLGGYDAIPGLVNSQKEEQWKSSKRIEYSLAAKNIKGSRALDSSSCCIKHHKTLEKQMQTQIADEGSEIHTNIPQVPSALTQKAK